MAETDINRLLKGDSSLDGGNHGGLRAGLGNCSAGQYKRVAYASEAQPDRANRCAGTSTKPFGGAVARVTRHANSSLCCLGDETG